MNEEIVKKDFFDRLQCAKMQEETPTLAADAKQNLPLVEDVYAAAYRTKVELHDNVAPERLMEAKTVATALETPEWEDLHRKTRRNALLSAWSAHNMFQTIAETMEKLSEKFKNQKGQPTPEQLDDALRDQRAGMRSSMAASDQEIGDMVDAAKLCGHDPGDGTVIPQEDLLYLLKKISSHHQLAEIMKMAGRMVSTYETNQILRCRDAPSEVFDITYGNDMSLLLPEELALLVEAPDVFYLRAIEKRQLMLEKNDPSVEKEGNIVVAIDKSGSMSGELQVIAMAIFVAFFRIAQKDKRGTHFITFDTKVYESRAIDCNISSRELIDLVTSVQGGGGTEFDPPLKEAMRVCKENPKADIIFITDGASSVSDEVVAEITTMKANGLKVYGVLLEQNSEEIKKVCSRIYQRGIQGDTFYMELLKEF